MSHSICDQHDVVNDGFVGCQKWGFDRKDWWGIEASAAEYFKATSAASRKIAALTHGWNNHMDLRRWELSQLYMCQMGSIMENLSPIW